MATEGDDRTESYTPNQYGYGLCLQLTDDQVEALGLNKNPPPAGSKVGIQAIAIVRRVTQEADPNGAAEGEGSDDLDVTLELQITDMEVNQPRDAAASAGKLYGG